MLRPATPLTILLFAAFVLLLMSVLSTPIIKQIPLASFGGVDFGVFGFCEPKGCSSIEIGYSTSSLFNPDQEASFDLPPSTRATLSAILIVHPIATFFTLVMLVLSGAAHLHAPSHSPRYLLGIFILSILTLVTSLLAFLIDVLLFVPHMAWGSYIVLAATILIAASGIVSCAMRRTLVSRKARKRRIEENAEMNGDNYYGRQGNIPAMPRTASNTLVNSSSAVDKLPAFATFEMAKKEPERTSDERIPLTTQSPSGTSPQNNIPGMAVSDNRYGGQMGGSPPRDQYGNLIQRGPAPYGSRSRDPSVDPSLNRQYSDNSMNSRGRGMPPGGYRGRGGFAPNGRGGYGPPNGRGGYGPQRGGYGPPRGGYGGPSRGGMADGMAAGAMMRGGRGGPPPGYARGPSPGGDYSRRPSNPEQNQYGNDQYRGPQAGGYAAYNPDNRPDSLARAESPPPLAGSGPVGPVGQAIEMDATTGSPSPSLAPRGFGQFGGIRDSDGDVAGMVGLQQQKIQRHETLASQSSMYSSEEYVPPRQAWGDQGRSSPLNSAPRAVELPSDNTPRHRRQSSDHYYEDVDPRFAEPVPQHPSNLPPAIATGYGNNNSGNNLSVQPVHGLDGQSSYEDLQSGARSPAESDRSNFTSVSQRGVNPRWNAGGGPGYGPMPNRRPVNQQAQQRDILLNSNPDFQLPGGRGGARQPRGGAGGMIPSSAYPGGAL